MRRLDGHRARRAGGFVPRSVTPALDPIQAILGSNLAEIWYAQDAVTAFNMFTGNTEVQTISGRIARTILTKVGPNGTGPVYFANEPDWGMGAAFVPNYGFTSCLQNTSLPSSLVPAGNRPFFFIVGYSADTALASFGVLMDIINDSSFPSSGTRWSMGLDTANYFVTGGATQNASAPWDVGPKLLAHHVDPTSLSLWMDNSLQGTKPGGATMSPAPVRITVGDSYNVGPGNGAPSSHFTAVVGLCRNAPTAGELSALWTYCNATYGVT